MLHMHAACYMLRTAGWSVVGCTLQVACLRTAFVPTLLIFPLLLLAIVLLLLPLFFLHETSASNRPGLTARLQWPRTFLRFSAASLSLASCARFGAAVAGGGGGIVPQPPQDAQARWQVVWERVGDGDPANKKARLCPTFLNFGEARRRSAASAVELRKDMSSCSC